VAITPDGGIVAVGSAYHEFNGYGSASVARYGPDGVLVWSNIIDSTSNDSFESVVVAPDGSIIAVGSAHSGSGEHPAINGIGDALVVSFAATGEINWAKTYGGADGDWFSSVGVAPNGTIIAAGSAHSGDGDFSASNGRTGALVVSMTTTGEINWHTTYSSIDSEGVLSEEFLSVAVAPDGTIMVVGRIMCVDGVYPTCKGDSDSLVVSLTATGEIAWSHNYGGAAWEWLKSVDVAADGSIIAVGYTDSGDGDFPASQGSSDALVVCLAPTGEIIWARTYGGNSPDSFSSVRVAPDGSIIAVGDTDLGGGDFPYGYGQPDALVAVMTSDGSISADRPPKIWGSGESLP